MDGLESIEVEKLTVRREGRLVLSDVSLSLNERRIGIVGRNGSGKSTLARVLAGLQQLERGIVRVGGIDPWRDRRGLLRRLGILFQNADHQIFMPTVIEEVAFGLRHSGHSSRVARLLAGEALAEHGREHWSDRSVSALSEGQRRFLCLISVLAMKPDTIILDEPFAGLDLPTSWYLQDWLAGLDKRLILITHDPRTLAEFERVIWLESGQVSADGPTKSVLREFEAAMKREAKSQC